MLHQQQLLWQRGGGEMSNEQSTVGSRRSTVDSQQVPVISMAITMNKILLFPTVIMFLTCQNIDPDKCDFDKFQNSIKNFNFYYEQIGRASCRERV